MAELSLILLGAVGMATLAAGVFFFRFWREGRDRLFLLFALSFLLQAVNRIALALSERPNEGNPWHYGVRLVAYALIIGAFIDKNRGPDTGRRER
jgi:uncharacterized membrane protein HdeD (DUF308 family)